ncbi:MAG: CPBP family intramembrane metalloprotease [Puniceicoccales bacterium]|jgi:membrane protease YdiL (CAAX protease family)|nr:CPBP family intramembrane metalloprotease [Puniceicoccales bacterium]
MIRPDRVFIALIFLPVSHVVLCSFIKQLYDLLDIKIDEMMIVLLGGAIANVCELVLAIYIIRKESLLDCLKSDFRNLIKNIFPALGRSLICFLISIPLLIFCEIFWKKFLILLMDNKIIHINLDAQYLVGHFAQVDSGLKLSLMLINTILLCPMMEEIIFRFLLYRFLKLRMAYLAGMLISSVVFATMHCNLALWLPLFAMGLILVHSYERFGNLLIPIAIHAIFNMLTTCVLYWQYF